MHRKCWSRCQEFFKNNLTTFYLPWLDSPPELDWRLWPGWLFPVPEFCEEYPTEAWLVLEEFRVWLGSSAASLAGMTRSEKKGRKNNWLILKISREKAFRKIKQLESLHHFSVCIIFLCVNFSPFFSWVQLRLDWKSAEKHYLNYERTMYITFLRCYFQLWEIGNQNKES